MEFRSGASAVQNLADRGEEVLRSDLATILRRALRDLLEGEGDLPRTAQEGTSAALAILHPAGPGNPHTFTLVHYRGEQEFFPGDLVSLFILAGVALQAQKGAIVEDEHVERDILRMVRARDADSANLLIDRVTGTLSGPEMPEANLDMFRKRRGTLDALLRGIGVSGTRCEQKIWDRTPYGRDAQLLGPGRSGDNRATSMAVAILFARLLQGQVGSAEASAKVLELLRAETSGPPFSACRPRLSAGVPAGALIWGWRTAGARLLHEAVAVELPTGARYCLALLSHLGERNALILESLGRRVADGISALVENAELPLS